MAGQKKRSVTPPKEEDRIIRVDPRESDGTFNNGPQPGYRDTPPMPSYTPLPAPPKAAPPKAAPPKAAPPKATPPKATPPKATAPVKPKLPGKPGNSKAAPPVRKLPAKPTPGKVYPFKAVTKKKK